MRFTAKEPHPQLWSAKSSMQRSEPHGPKVKMDGKYTRWKCVNYELPGPREAALSAWLLYCASCWPLAASFSRVRVPEMCVRVFEKFGGAGRVRVAEFCWVFAAIVKGSFHDSKHVISVAFSPNSSLFKHVLQCVSWPRADACLSNKAALHTLRSWRFQSPCTLEAGETVPERPAPLRQESKQTKKMCNIWRWAFAQPDFHLTVRNISDGPKES